MLRSAPLLLVLTFSATAGEYAVLANGSRIHADRHDSTSEVVRLFTNTGTVEFPASAVRGFEQEEYTPPPVPAATVPAPATKAAVIGTRGALEIVTEAANRAGLPPELVHSVVRAESGYNARALSPKGAIGLMQLMPGTAAALNANPWDPEQNALAGAMYLRALLIRYQDDDHQVSKAIAAYNAGPGAVSKYRGVPPYRETQNYVRRVITGYTKARGAPSKRTAGSGGVSSAQHHS